MCVCVSRKASGEGVTGLCTESEDWCVLRAREKAVRILPCEVSVSETERYTVARSTGV